MSSLRSGLRRFEISHMIIPTRSLIINYWLYWNILSFSKRFKSKAIMKIFACLIYFAVGFSGSYAQHNDYIKRNFSLKRYGQYIRTEAIFGRFSSLGHISWIILRLCKYAICTFIVATLIITWNKKMICFINMIFDCRFGSLHYFYKRQLRSKNEFVSGIIVWLYRLKISQFHCATRRNTVWFVG